MRAPTELLPHIYDIDLNKAQNKLPWNHNKYLTVECATCLESDGFTENKDFSLPLQRLYCAVLYLFSACSEASDA